VRSRRGRERSERSTAAEPSSVGPEDEAKRAVEHALRALSRRGLTASELRTRLSDRGFRDAAVEASLARVAELGYVDDAAIADAVLRDASRAHHGTRRIARTLARRGVASSVAEEAVRDRREEDLASARAFVAKRFPAGVGGDLRARARALRMLFARGFSHDVARLAIGVDVDLGD
jgi:regulatory protein